MEYLIIFLAVFIAMELQDNKENARKERAELRRLNDD